ncbi:MAG: tRNA (adenosine(37)-N6)-dimethylallyltransferase, partial [Gemmatimonadales bacterium]
MSALIAILGPTGSGKSDLALAVAERLDGEIVNYDSIQVYRSYRIGAAKLDEAGRRGIPHHLIDILEPGELFTAGEFARRAGEMVRDIGARGRLPILAGGTGFYLRALLDGLFPGPTRDEA